MKLLHMMLILTLSITLMGCQPKLTVTKAADEFINNDYRDVEAHLKEVGFHNIAFKELGDLNSQSKDKHGRVESISINQYDSFKENDVFSEDALVVIAYHSMKKMKLPLTLKEIRYLDASNLIKHFEDAGFENIKVEEVYDLNEENLNAFENELKINGAKVEREQDAYPCDSEVTIIVHRPTETFQVNLQIKFPANVMFNKYDVEMYLNGDKFDLLHGEDKEYTLNLTPGDYQLVFKKADNHLIQGEYQLYVNDDVEVKLEVKSSFTKIEVSELDLNYVVQLQEDDIQIPFQASSFKNQPYEEVVAYLNQLGFENVVAIPVYDIVWGFIQEGNCESVIVNGSTNYVQNSLVKKDVEIIVTYHMQQNSQSQDEIQITL
ncbi:MAG: hypothetical protein UIM26_03300 [Longicatena sp.]|nr:hypothetical protein [Longicatena sp.]